MPRWSLAFVMALVMSACSSAEVEGDPAPSIPQKQRVEPSSDVDRALEGSRRRALPALRRPAKAAPLPGEDAVETSAPSGPPPEIARPYDPSADAEADIAAALARARETKTRVLLVFGGNWCPWCRRLAYTFRHDPHVARELAEGFQVVHVDATGESNDALIARYGSPTKHGVPVLVVLDHAGEVLYTQATGPLEKGDRHDPAKVVEFLKAARE